MLRGAGYPHHFGSRGSIDAPRVCDSQTLWEEAESKALQMWPSVSKHRRTQQTSKEAREESVETMSKLSMAAIFISTLAVVLTFIPNPKARKEADAGIEAPFETVSGVGTVY